MENLYVWESWEDIKDTHFAGSEKMRADKGVRQEAFNFLATHFPQKWKAARYDLSGLSLDSDILRQMVAKEGGFNVARSHCMGTKFELGMLEDLSKSSFFLAIMIGADLDDASLSSVNFEGADLRLASLRDANLQKASLVKANLAKANLTGTDLSEANLTGTDLTQAHLGWQFSNFKNFVRFDKTQIDNADFSGVVGPNISIKHLKDLLQGCWWNKEGGMKFALPCPMALTD